jgi:hypothetical protein
VQLHVEGAMTTSVLLRECGRKLGPALGSSTLLFKRGEWWAQMVVLPRNTSALFAAMQHEVRGRRAAGVQRA